MKSSDIVLAPPVYVIAKLAVSEKEAPSLLSALHELVCATKLEAGCIEYSLYRDTFEERSFVIHEVWRSQDDLDAHMYTPHFLNFISRVEALSTLTSDVNKISFTI